MAPQINPKGDNWHLGDAPSLALTWAVESLAKAGTLSILGAYPQTARVFPIGSAVNKNLTIAMGNCHHRRYIPKLLELVRSGVIQPARVLTQEEPLTDVIDACKAFDTRQPGWMKVRIKPEQRAPRVSA